MDVSEMISDTPKYVLMASNIRIGPRIATTQDGTEFIAIYGFSNKEAYNTFCTSSQLLLKPYPLVKGYLRNEMDASGDHLLLVILNASGPAESCIAAATFRAVLEAQAAGCPRVSVDYQLSLMKETDCYRLNEPCTHQNVAPEVMRLT